MACSEMRLEDDSKLRHERNMELLYDTLKSPKDTEFSDQELVEIENKWNKALSGLQNIEENDK